MNNANTLPDHTMRCQIVRETLVEEIPRNKAT